MNIFLTILFSLIAIVPWLLLRALYKKTVVESGLPLSEFKKYIADDTEAKIALYVTIGVPIGVSIFAVITAVFCFFGNYWILLGWLVWIFIIK